MKPSVLFICIAAASCSAPELGFQQWQLVEEWRVGGQPEGAHSFDFNLGLANLPNGGFVHFDFRSRQLYFLNERGDSIRAVGRAGEGPGEFNIVNGLVVAPDGRVIVSDLASGFTIHDDSGAFVKVVKPESGRLGTGGRWDAFAFASGEVVENVTLMAGSGGAQQLRLVWSADLSHVDTLPRLMCTKTRSGSPTTIPLLDSNGNVMLDMPLMFAAPSRPAAFDHDGFVWESPDQSANRIVRHPLRDCGATSTIHLAGAQAAIDSSERRIMADMAIAEAKRWQAAALNLEDLPQVHAWYRAIAIGAAGNVWVERTASDGSLVLEVYSSSGAPVAEIKGLGLPVGAMITGTHVYGLVADKDDIRYLVAYRIAKS
jgi:hypothetical protein